jgi:hypothetical protein
VIEINYLWNLLSRLSTVGTTSIFSTSLAYRRAAQYLFSLLCDNILYMLVQHDPVKKKRQPAAAHCCGFAFIFQVLAAAPIRLFQSQRCSHACLLPYEYTRAASKDASERWWKRARTMTPLYVQSRAHFFFVARCEYRGECVFFMDLWFVMRLGAV